MAALCKYSTLVCNCSGLPDKPPRIIQTKNFKNNKFLKFIEHGNNRKNEKDSRR